MKFRIKKYEFWGCMLNDIAAQIRLSFNHVIEEPWFGLVKTIDVLVHQCSRLKSTMHTVIKNP